MVYREYGGGIEGLMDMDPENAIKEAKAMGYEAHLKVETLFETSTGKARAISITKGNPGDPDFKEIRRMKLDEFRFPEKQQEVLDTARALSEDVRMRDKVLAERMLALEKTPSRGIQGIVDFIKRKNTTLSKLRAELREELWSVFWESSRAWEFIEKSFYEAKVSQETPTDEQQEIISDGVLATFQELQNRLNEVEKKLAALEK